jgi:SAM-dependent methyltransferase
VTGEDRDRWDARHAAVSDDRPLPPDELRHRMELLPAGGRALDVACGRGAVAVWLALRGFVVDAVDASGVGLAAAAGLAARHGVAATVRLTAHDLDSGLPDACPGPYEVVVCQRFRDPRLYPRLVERLAAGGLLVVTVLSEVGDEPGRWRAAPGELRAAFGGLTVLTVLAEREGSGAAGLLARRR